MNGIRMSEEGEIHILRSDNNTDEKSWHIVRA